MFKNHIYISIDSINIYTSPLDQFDTYRSFGGLLYWINHVVFTFFINTFGIIEKKCSGSYVIELQYSNALVTAIIFCYVTLVVYRLAYRVMLSDYFVISKKLINLLLDMVREIVQPIRVRRKQFLSFSTFIFLSILTKNCYSQLPASKAITATIQLPFCYSISFCVAFNLLFLLRNKPIESLTFFVPSAIPMEMSPFLWIIEVISHLIKVISLAVRLCANIFSGHVLLDIILTALFLILAKGGSSLFIIFLIFQLVGFAIQLLETFIGFLQAFVFLTLTSIYTSEIFSGH